MALTCGNKVKGFGHDELFDDSYGSRAYFSLAYKILLLLSPDFSPNNTCERVTAANLGNCSAVCITQANYSTDAIEICVST